MNVAAPNINGKKTDQSKPDGNPTNNASEAKQRFFSFFTGSKNLKLDELFAGVQR